MMAFTVNDFADLKQLLFTHPEWRVDLRQILLTDELLSLPEIVRDLAEAQKRTEARVAELAEAQKRTEDGLSRLEAVVRELAVVLAGHGDALRRLEEQSVHMVTDLGDLRGYRLEQKYAQHAAAYFGNWIRKVRRILPDGLDSATEDRLEEHLSQPELTDFLLADIVVSGVLRKPLTSEKTQVWLVVEVSATIDQGDVERAWRRAGLARQAGFLAIAVVAGDGLTEGATVLAKQKSVVVMLDGRGVGWDDAISAL